LISLEEEEIEKHLRGEQIMLSNSKHFFQVDLSIGEGEEWHIFKSG